LLLVAKAREGKMVVRLKGGDPFVLGRGGEEAETLAGNGIPLEVVPGVSSAYAVPAYAGIPVTDRRLASSFMVLTGHEDADKVESTIHWDKVSVGSDTLVILMGMNNMAPIVTELIRNGRPASTPVAVISQGTGPQQRTVVGTLKDIADRARKEGIAAPAVIVVGEVVKLRGHLRWFDNLPLFSKRILVTRPEEQAEELSQLLRGRGALPIEMPVIKIIPPVSWEELDQAIQGRNYGWVVFTSVNAVEMFFSRLHALRLDTRWLGEVKIGAIGPVTAKTLEKHGVCPDYVPQVYTSQGFLSGLAKKAVQGQKILLPRADIAGNELTDGLTGLHAEVHQVTAYRTVAADADSPGKEMLLKGEIDIITFTSASTVNNLMAVLGKEWQAIKKAKLACIGPNTAAVLEQKGLKPDIVAVEHTIPGLVAAIEQYYEAEVAR
jgi:uroporphyrinogen III methyltransferase/synthase